MKTVGGFRRTRYRGLDRTGFAGYLVGTVYNLVRIAWLMTAQTPAPQGRVTMGREAAPQVTDPEAGPSTGRHTTQQRVFSDIAVMPAALTSPRNPFFRNLLEGNYLCTTDVGIASRSAGKHDNLALFARRSNGSAHTLETLGVAPA